MTLLVDTSVWSLALRRDDAVLETAAEVRNVCRRAGVQIGTIDALLIQLCGRHQLTMLSTDRDFLLATRFVPFRLWSSSTPSGA